MISRATVHESLAVRWFIVVLCRFVPESFFGNSGRHLQLQLSGTAHLLSQCDQVSPSCHCSAAQPSLPESQVTVYCF